MGRKHRRYTDYGPRTTFPATQELWRANRDRPSPSFGIRRPLTEAASDKVVNLLSDLQTQGIIPAEPQGQVRDSPAITLLSRKAVGRVLQRGGADYDLEAAKRAITRNAACNRRDEALTVRLGQVRPLGRTLLYATVETPQVENELAAANNALAVAGLRSLAKKGREVDPHITLVNASRGKAFGTEDLDTMVAVLNRVMPKELDVAGWESYPFDLFEDEREPAENLDFTDELAEFAYD